MPQDYTKTYTYPAIDLNGGTIDGATIGATTPAAGSFTDVTVKSATPTIALEDATSSKTAAAFINNTAADNDDAVLTIGVDDSGGDDQTYIELDGVNEDVEIKKPMVATSIAASSTMMGLYSILTDSDISGDNISAAQAKNGCIIFNDSNGAVDYNLPTAAAGMSIWVKAVSAHTITLDSYSGDVLHLIDGTALDAADSIVSDGTNGASIWLVAYNATDWWVMSQVGAWSDAGA